MKRRSWLASVCLVIWVSVAFGQTFQINNPSGPGISDNKTSSGRVNDPSGAEAQSLGWGASIEVARQARAAQDAMQRGDYAAATAYAERAAKSAPGNAEFWFLLGYASRLAGGYQVSVDAYKRGLQNRPNAIRGFSGLAQTYAKMGRKEEARQLLLRIIQANPNDASNLQLAGELMLDSDPQQALELLRRADALQPSARGVLLIARAYQRLHQPELAKQFLERAKRRAPRDPEVARAAASQYRDAGQYDLAISTLQALLPRKADELAEFAYTYELAGQKQQAADLYVRAARVGKGNVGFELSAAQALVNVGRLEEARGFLDGVRKIDPNHYRLHAILGQLAGSEGRLADASHEYQLAISNLPRSILEGPLYTIQLRLNLYEVYQQSGDTSNAKQQLDLAAAEIGRVNVSELSRPAFLSLRAAIESASGNLDAADRDIKEALLLAPNNVGYLLNYATLLWKRGQREDAHNTFLKALNLDPNNRQNLTSLGYLARDMGDVKSAESYFSRAAKMHTKDFVPYLALGDLYAAERNYSSAQASYEAAYQRMPGNPLIVAGGAAAALEAHNLDLAKDWLDRATGTMNDNPQIMRERERYLTWKGAYQEAAELGYKVIQQLPRDPQAPIYLAYDLYYLGRYEEAMELVTRYEAILPRDKDLALIAGYVHAHFGQFQVALHDFTRALERDPKMATGYVNRGFVLNRLKQPAAAKKDFLEAIQLRSDYGEAHLGLAYSYLQLRDAQPALEELAITQKLLGETHAWHLARAEAFRQQLRFSFAEKEYRAALAEIPNDLTTQLALADVLYQMRRYDESIQSLNVALNLSPSDPAVYAQMAQAYARMGQQNQMLRYVRAAEQSGTKQADILMKTGSALLDIGHTEAAMHRFSRALDAADADRVSIRLAFARIFAQQGRWDDARRQIGLGFAEARVGDAQPVTAENFVEAANILLALHDFDISRTYFDKARLAGASDRLVTIGLANSYLAEGNTGKAETELASLGEPSQYKDDYDYMMARANLYRQRQDTVQALSTFAKASTLSGLSDDEAIQDVQYELAGEEGRQVNQVLSLSSRASFAPVLEDINIYTLDAKVLGVTDTALLPPPRHSFQSFGKAHYRLHLSNLPTIAGFVGESMTSGRLSFPSTSTVQERRTYDSIFNGGIVPVLRLGANTLAFNAGLQFTLRRDALSPMEMNQNLFRQFLYLSSSPFFNWVSVRGSLIRETGPFTRQDLHSRDLSASLEFTVGRPWGNTSLLAGYSVRDLLFRPTPREYFTTSTYVGLQRKFGKRLTAAILGEYLRSWRVQDNTFAIAQAVRPRANFEFRANRRWNVAGSFRFSRGEGFHAYDNVESEFLISYLLPVRGKLEGEDGTAQVAYPSRFSFGVQQQTFYNFAGSSRTVILPVVRLQVF